MLEVFCDAHTHCVPDDYCALCCATSREQWERQDGGFDTILSKEAEQEVAKSLNHRMTGTSAKQRNIYRAFGIDPLDAAGDISFLCTLLEQDRLDAVGEAGFDFRAKGSRQDSALVRRQETLWQAQLQLALQYDKPLVVHCVHAMDYIFKDTRALSHLRSVVFHAFAGTSQDARSLLRHGVNAYFSFGARLMASGRTTQCAASVPPDRLLLETDSLDEQRDIREVYMAAATIRGIGMGELCAAIYRNFNAVIPLSASNRL